MFIEKNWYNLKYNQCPFCGQDLERIEKKWNERAKKESMYLNCFDCDFWIAEKKAQDIIYNLETGDNSLK